MELEGRVVRLLPLKEGVSQSTGNPYRTQDFIFGYYENQSDIYERNIVLNVRNENIEKYNLKENDKIKVRIALSCREYPQDSGRYFNDIRTGDITVIQKVNVEPAQQANTKAVGQQQAQQNQGQQQDPVLPQPGGGGDADDLPF